MRSIRKEKNNRIREILRRRDGATIVFALVVFMVAAIVSVTIVNVALTNLRRVSGRRNDEQARIAVMSAVNYLQSNGDDLNAKLNSLTAGDEGKSWTVEPGSGYEALETTIKWTEILDSLRAAEVKSGDYIVEVKLAYDDINAKWSVSRLKKKS